MEKIISFEKLSKKKQRERNRQKRITWGNLHPATRKINSKKVYNRKKARNWNDHPDFALSCFFIDDE